MLDATEGKDIGDFRGGDRPRCGRYHVIVRSVEDKVSDNGTPYYEFELEVLTGTVSGQEGKTLSCKAWYGKNTNQLRVMAIAVGILTPGKPADQGGTCEQEALLNAENAQLIVDAEEEEYQGRKQIKVNFGIWPVGHPDVAECPINQAAYDLWKSGGAPATAAAAAAGSSPGIEDDYSNL